MVTQQTLKENETFESRDLFIKARESIKRGNYRSGRSYLEKAVKIAPANPTYLSYLGLCLAMEGCPRKGRSSCARAVKISSSEPVVYVNLGRVLLEEGRKREARDMFLRAYRMDQTDAAAALELSGMGIRRNPVLNALDRSHPINIYLGKIRHRILNWLHR